MLLLDHNLPRQLRDLLVELGLDAETALHRGWESLRNGELTAAAHAAGFRTILTRDSKFAESASHVDHRRSNPAEKRKAVRDFIQRGLEHGSVPGVGWPDQLLALSASHSGLRID